MLAADADAVRHTPPKVVADVRRERTGLVTWAAAEGAPGAVELLVEAGFDVNAVGRSDIFANDPWHTALHVAAEKGDLDLARTLLGLGADPNLRDERYKATPLGRTAAETDPASKAAAELRAAYDEAKRLSGFTTKQVSEVG